MGLSFASAISTIQSTMANIPSKRPRDFARALALLSQYLTGTMEPAILSALHSVTFSNSAGEQNFSKKEKTVAKPNDFATVFWSG